MKVNPDAMKKQAGKAHQLLAAMANEKRLLILCQLIDGERSVNEIAELTGVSRNTVKDRLLTARQEFRKMIRRDRVTGGKRRTA